MKKIHFHSGGVYKMNKYKQVFEKPISIYSTKQAIKDGFLIKVGELHDKIPIIFTSNLFRDKQDNYKIIINKGLKLLKMPNDEDSNYMKLRIIEKNKIWVIFNSEGIIFMRPEDY
jgi:type I site-specific restriction-modification system R (restriction) subunit